MAEYTDNLTPALHNLLSSHKFEPMGSEPEEIASLPVRIQIRREADMNTILSHMFSIPKIAQTCT